jgi:hypothetical protein
MQPINESVFIGPNYVYAEPVSMFPRLYFI